jgi:hypothetical protein
MKIDNSFALAVSLAIAVSLTATMTQVRAESEAVQSPAASMQMRKVKMDTSLTRTKLRTMSADSVIKLNQEGKIKLSPVELKEVNGLVGKGKKVGGIDPGKVSVSTVMCPW